MNWAHQWVVTFKVVTKFITWNVQGISFGYSLHNLYFLRNSKCHFSAAKFVLCEKHKSHKKYYPITSNAEKEADFNMDRRLYILTHRHRSGKKYVHINNAKIIEI
jgi:hypothetical protein